MGRWNNDSQVSKTFDKELDQFTKGELAGNHVFDLGRMPGYLIGLGFKDSRFTHMSGEDLRHGIPEAVLPEMKGFAEHWRNPVAVFSGQTADDMRVILDIGSREKPHYLAVAIDRNYNSYPITAIREVTSSPELKIMKLVEQDRALWLDKERMMAIYTRQHLRGHQNGNINMNYAKTVIEHFRNPGEERVVFDIDDYLEQVGGRSLPYTGEPAKRLVDESLKNVVYNGWRVRYPVNIGTTGYYKDKNSVGKTVWTAFDNTAGDCYVEDFMTKEAARAYALKFEEADYAREVDARQEKHETEYMHTEGKAEDDRSPFLSEVVISEDNISMKDVGTIAFDDSGEKDVEMVFSDGHAEELPALDDLSTEDMQHLTMTYPTVAEVEKDTDMREQIERYTGRRWEESTFQEKVYDTALKFGAVSIDRHVKIAAEQDGNTVLWTGHNATEARELFDKGETIAVMTSDRNPVSSLTSEVEYTRGAKLFYDPSRTAETFDDVVEDFADWQENDGYGHMPDREAAGKQDFSYWTKTVYPVTRTVPQQQAVNPEMQVFIKNLVTATVAPGEHKQLPAPMYLSNRDLPQRAWTHFGLEHDTLVLYADARKSYPSVSILSSMLTEKEKSSVYKVIRTVCQASKQQEEKGISLVRTQEQHAQQAAGRGDDGKALTDFLGIVLPKPGYDITFDQPVHAHYTGVDGLHDIRIKEVVRVIGRYVMGDGQKHVGIEHLTASSKAKLLTESVAQCAREAVFIRATGPSNHFIEEERRFINIATRGMTASEKDTYFSKLLSDLEPRFKDANTPQVWVDDVREELEDLAKGKVREDIISRGV